MNHSANTTRAGFTLIEMLIVVSITAIVLAFSFPMIGAMKRDSSASSGVNTISVAIPSIRRYATGDVTFPNDLDTTTAGDQAGAYSGAAAIFTPAGEIRLTRNYAGAVSSDFISGSRLLERHGPRVLDEQTGVGLPSRELNGFADLEVDYLQLPSDTGVAGINRVSGGPIGATNAGPPLLLPPPFAVWFSQNGYLVATGWDLTASPQRTNDYQFVYYDGNYDNDFRTLGPGARRGSINNYNPDWYNPDAGDYNPNNWDGVQEKYTLPFEMLEAVVGVYVYSRTEFQGAVDDGLINHWTDSSAAANTARWQWMRENGEMLMFSKQTGAMMRNRDQ